jgi:hypothetical protein
VSLFSGDASEVYKLAGDLSQIGARTVPALRGVMEAGGTALANDWSDNARATSGDHGKYYPDAIDSELVFDLGGVSVDVGPNSAKKQGGMGKGFEFGSENQPPHLDGVRALSGIEARLEAMIDATVGHLFG